MVDGFIPKDPRVGRSPSLLLLGYDVRRTFSYSEVGFSALISQEGADHHSDRVKRTRRATTKKVYLGTPKICVTSPLKYGVIACHS